MKELSPKAKEARRAWDRMAAEMGRTPEETIAQRIRVLRRQQGMTLLELQRAANRHLGPGEQLPYEAVTDIEQGRRRIRVNEWLALSAALSVAPIYTLTAIRPKPAARIGPTLVRTAFLVRWITGERPLSALVPDRDIFKRERP